MSRGPAGGAVFGVGRVKCNVAAQNGKSHRLADELAVSNDSLFAKSFAEAIKESLDHCRSNSPDRKIPEMVNTPSERRLIAADCVGRKLSPGLLQLLCIKAIHSRFVRTGFCFVLCTAPRAAYPVLV